MEHGGDVGGGESGRGIYPASLLTDNLTTSCDVAQNDVWR
jgi:hypothetical protein